MLDRSPLSDRYWGVLFPPYHARINKRILKVSISRDQLLSKKSCILYIPIQGSMDEQIGWKMRKIYSLYCCRHCESARVYLRSAFANGQPHWTILPNKLLLLSPASTFATSSYALSLCLFLLSCVFDLFGSPPETPALVIHTHT